MGGKVVYTMIYDLFSWVFLFAILSLVIWLIYPFIRVKSNFIQYCFNGFAMIVILIFFIGFFLQIIDENFSPSFYVLFIMWGCITWITYPYFNKFHKNMQLKSISLPQMIFHYFFISLISLFIIVLLGIIITNIWRP